MFRFIYWARASLLRAYTEHTHNLSASQPRAQNVHAARSWAGNVVERLGDSCDDDDVDTMATIFIKIVLLLC